MFATQLSLDIHETHRTVAQTGTGHQTINVLKKKMLPVS
jgi:hypothetical protein